MSEATTQEWWKDLEKSNVSEVRVHTEPSGDIYIERNFDPIDEIQSRGDDDYSTQEIIEEDPPAPPSPPSRHSQSSPSLISTREFQHSASTVSPRSWIERRTRDGDFSTYEKIEEDHPAPPSPNPPLIQPSCLTGRVGPISAMKGRSLPVFWGADS